MGERHKPLNEKGLWGDHPKGANELSPDTKALGISLEKRNGVIPLRTPEAITRPPQGQVRTREKIFMTA